MFSLEKSVLLSSYQAIPKDSVGLGCPIPQDCHAVSVSLPTWSAVVGYEEGDASICNQLAIGYPRFKIHIYHEIMVQKLIDDYDDNDGATTCMVVPSQSVALRLLKFLRFSDTSHSKNVVIKRIEGTNYFGVYFNIQLKAKAKAYWQHAGEIISSRQSMKALAALGVSAPTIWFQGHAVLSNMSRESSMTTNTSIGSHVDKHEVMAMVKHRIVSVALPAYHSSMTSEEIDATITITVSGMSAIFTALRLFQAYSGHGIVVVFGFPYLDTLKLMQREEWNPDGCIFLGHGEGSDYDELIRLLQLHNISSADDRNTSFRPRIKALFTEFPSNPLLKCPDLTRIMQLAHDYDFLVAVDDTISSYANVNIMSGPVKVDVVCSSLTKIFSGVGNVLAGGLFINPLGQHAVALRQIIASNALEVCSISVEDVAVLECNSRDFIPRAYLCSANALELSKRLIRHPSVKQLYYPGLRHGGQADTIYTSCLQQPSSSSHDYDGQPGYGCLLSILLYDESGVPTFFDELAVSKGPSLGTNFTLSCPYTLLAHYQELPWAASYGVDKYIVRVSVGLEDIDDLWRRFEYALDRSCGERIDTYVSS